MNRTRRLPLGAMKRTLPAFAMVLITLMVGCGETKDSPKASHFEHDHIIAEHWPEDLPDVAAKLRSRLESDSINEQTHAEILDLVTWTPEIAADTNLTEQDWIPLHEATESTLANLRASQSTNLTESDKNQILALCFLIDETANLIPEQLPTFSSNDP
ncbi:hypothetical protein LOC70_08795 [Rhodopirellula sp. JC737]|nr:hypothetical protein [Rhodopirellula sp. JC737]